MSRTLSAWLDRLERLHPVEIEMGLERVAAVRDRLSLKPDFPCVLVGGTNGKGSTCAVLESIYCRAGYSVGLYTSPHLMKYNERVRVNGCEVGDEELVDAFERVDQARGEISLTYFEFGTLAAQVIFCTREVELAVLEVGLGGRLDAVNAFEPACSVVVSVGVDHIEFLGPDREAIGREKAGIFRGGIPAVCADEDPPASLVAHARAVGADLHLIGRDFGHANADTAWHFWNRAGKKTGLPFPALRGSCQLDNAAAALECVWLLQSRLPVDMGSLRNGLIHAHCPGRFQVLPGKPLVILDVAHNAAAARALSNNIRQMPGSGRTFAVFAVLKDKQIGEITLALSGQVDRWFVCDLPVARAATATTVKDILLQQQAKVPVDVFADVASGLAAAREAAREDDRILLFGSFYTVSQALESSDTLNSQARC
ncbi:MAG TPA: bifunctional tetrahydrofolate synthase/dihydrofolate synthase [Burkholderiales bacterium]|nr:bifunctional tetrahydrofolate synthase/dihydrofolate synthase [Burkholderiales bacterium]